VVTLPALSLIASTSLSSSAVTVSTPANLQVSAQSGWDGIINAPRVELNSSVSVMADSGKTAAVAATLEVGAGNVALTFDQGVRLLIPGAVGKYMGYQRNSDFSKITTTCSADNQAVGDTLAVGADCKVDVGSDVVIWTKHFTKFIAYTQDNIVASVSVSSGGGGGGGGGSSVPSVVIVAPIVVAPIITPELVEEKVVRKTFEEIATPISNASTDQIEIVHDLNKEKLVDKKYIISLIKDIKQVNLATQTALINFIAYGTKITLSLGEGERAGVLGSYKSAFKKLPTSNSEWSDVIKIASGHWPSEKNLTSEKDSETAFQKIYKRKPVRSNANDDAAVTIIAYGLRPSARNTVSEKNAILSFKKIYGYAPVSATAWDIVRAIAYSGSKR
ncbi:MAG: hypothetical protein NT091_04505, partial [Candidatus Falkowbacteria bacterium]|nr:hypothetical protein [Candidatus Falkowbacteria bacterium]